MEVSIPEVQLHSIDDGTDGDWEQFMDMSKKAQKRQEEVAIQVQEEGSIGRPIPGQGIANSIPGIAPVAVQRVTQAEINAVFQKVAIVDATAKTAVETEYAAVPKAIEVFKDMFMEDQYGVLQAGPLIECKNPDDL